MDRFTSVAKRQAWKDPRNPFGRTNSDVEKGVRRAFTEPTYCTTSTGGFAGAAQQNRTKVFPSSKNKRPETINTQETKVSKYADKRFTVLGQLGAIFFGSWINILLIAAPVGIVLGVLHQNFIAVFVVNFIAIIPLAALLSYATEEIALRVGETLGGLLNATFGNAVEVIVSIIALTKDEIIVVKTSLIGSILSNLLLVLGMCFLFGGLRREEQFFNTTVAQTAAGLLALAIAGVIIPTVFDLFLPGTEADRVAKISRGTAIMLLFVYGAYLFFQLKTHSEMYNRESQKVPIRPWKKHAKAGDMQRGIAAAGAAGAAHGRTTDSVNEVSDQDGPRNPAAYEETPQKNDPEEPQLHMYTAVILLAASTAIVAACAEFLVGSIKSITSTGVVSTEFVGLILLPIVGNAAEHATAVTVAIKDKMDLAIGVAVGSSLQIALLVIPSTVVLGWCMGKDDMNLSFDGFQVTVLFIAVLLVNYLISDGKSHWLEGIMLNGLYAIIALVAWYYPHVEGL